MLDKGTYGAKVQSWKGANPRDLLRRIIDDNPAMDKPELLATLRHELLADDQIDYLDTVIEYWFSNNYHSLVGAMAAQNRLYPMLIASRMAKQAKAEVIKGKLRDHIQEVAETILLDMVLPNGKALRDCTGKQCAKAGGWLARVAEKVKPNQKVGVALSESQVRDLWRG